MIVDQPDLSRIDIKRLIERDVTLRYVAHTNGGEYAGPCPFCGTGDDRFRVWPDHPDGRGRYWCRVCDRSGDAIDYLRERDRLTYPQALEALRLYEGNAKPARHPDNPDRLMPKKEPGASGEESSPRYSRRETVARYTYVDEAGIPLFQVRRVHYYDENGQRLDKQFYQYRREEGQWQRGLKNTRRVIYRLPRVLAAVEAGETVYIVEGEKSVHTLEDLGLTATCNPMGARKWKPEYSAHFAGAHVVILPDADDDGLDHGNRVAESLIDTAESVKVINLPGLEYASTHGPDVVDWLADPGNTRERLLTLVEEAVPWHRPGAQAALFDDILDANAIPSHAANPLDYPVLPLDIGTGEIGQENDLSAAWLQAYVDYARQVSPTTPDLFHESAGLWVASTIIARRLRLPMAFGDVYPNLCVAWVAPPVLFNKTTALNIARRLVEDIAPSGLAPELSTVDALIGTLIGEVDETPRKKSRSPEHRYMAQLGWTVDDLSGLLADMAREPNAGRIDTIIRFLDCADNYQLIEAARAFEIRGTYLSLIGSGNPASLSGYLSDERLWNNGWWPRFVLLSPEESIPPGYSRATRTERPPALADKLLSLNGALPERARSGTPDAIDLMMDEGAIDLWEAYSKTVRHDLLVRATGGNIKLDRRLFSTYGRLPTQALKVAIILAALNWQGSGDIQIDLAHMGHALRIAERWRASAHRTLRLAEAAN